MRKLSFENLDKARKTVVSLMEHIDRRVENSNVEWNILMSACEASCNLTKVLVELEGLIASQT